MQRALTLSLSRLGRPLIEFSEYVRELLTMVYMACRSAALDNPRGKRLIWKIICAQVFFTGFGAVPVLMVLAVATGSVIILNTTDQSTLWGSGGMTGNVLYHVVVRELGPLVVGLLVIARSGTAVASELGAMRANREIDALKSLGINPLGFLVFPRFVGGVVSVLCLSFYFDIVAILGGFFMARALRDLSFEAFLSSISVVVTGPDLMFICAKILLNGFVIFSVCCFQGLRVKESLHEVPQVTTKAVVISVVTLTTLNFALTALWYLSGYFTGAMG